MGVRASSVTIRPSGPKTSSSARIWVISVVPAGTAHAPNEASPVDHRRRKAAPRQQQCRRCGWSSRDSQPAQRCPSTPTADPKHATDQPDQPPAVSVQRDSTPDGSRRTNGVPAPHQRRTRRAPARPQHKLGQISDRSRPAVGLEASAPRTTATARNRRPPSRTPAAGTRVRDQPQPQHQNPHRQRIRQTPHPNPGTRHSGTGRRA